MREVVRLPERIMRNCRNFAISSPGGRSSTMRGGFGGGDGGGVGTSSYPQRAVAQRCRNHSTLSMCAFPVENSSMGAKMLAGWMSAPKPSLYLIASSG